MCHVVAMALQYMSSNMYYYETDTFVFVIKLTKLTVLTFVSIGPGAMALNLIPYFPHSAASDLKTIINLKCHVQPKHLGCVPFNLWSGVLLLFFSLLPKKKNSWSQVTFHWDDLNQDMHKKYISDPRSLGWIAKRQRNPLNLLGKGLIGSFDVPWSKWS